MQLRSSLIRDAALCIALSWLPIACVVRDNADAGTADLASPTRAEPRASAGKSGSAAMSEGGAGAGGSGSAAGTGGKGGASGSPAAVGGKGGGGGSAAVDGCTTCTQHHPMCAQSWTGCQHLEGRAENGPKKGELKSSLCVAMVECFRRTRCAAGSDARLLNFTQCYCGPSSDGANCLMDASKPAAGACVAEIAAAVELREPNDVNVNLATPKYASGAAFDVLNKCDAVACAPFCGATCKRDSVSKLCSKKTGGLGCAADLDADAGMPMCDYTDPPPMKPAAGSGGSSAGGAGNAATGGAGSSAAGSAGSSTAGAGGGGAAGIAAGAGGA